MATCLCASLVFALGKFRQDARGVAAEATACVVDDTPDLPMMALVALPVAVADAHPDVIAAAGVVTTRPGGAGAVREVCDLLIDGRA